MPGSATLVRDDAVVGEEGALVRAWLDGDVTAFDALYQRHHPALVRLLRGRTGSVAAAEDLAQEVMIRALGKLADFDHRGPLWPWLRQIAINASIDAARARSRADALAAHMAVAPDVQTTTPAADVDLLERDVLVRALAEVPPRQRAALERCYLQGWRPSEAAADFGVCPNAFDQLLHRARGSLRTAYLRQQGEGHRAAHLGWLLGVLVNIEGLVARARHLGFSAIPYGEALPRLGEAVAATIVASSLLVLGAVGGPPPAEPQVTPAVEQEVPASPTTTGVRSGPVDGPAGHTAAPLSGAGHLPGQGAVTAPSDHLGPDRPFTRPDGPPPVATEDDGASDRGRLPGSPEGPDGVAPPPTPQLPGPSTGPEPTAPDSAEADLGMGEEGSSATAPAEPADPLAEAVAAAVG